MRLVGHTCIRVMRLSSCMGLHVDTTAHFSHYSVVLFSHVIRLSCTVDCVVVCVCVSVCVDSAAVSVGWGRHSQVWALLAWAVRHHLSLWQHRCHSCLLRVVCKLCRTNISRGSQLGLRRTHCDTVSVHSMASTWSTTTSTCSARLSQQSLVRLNTHTHTHTHIHCCQSSFYVAYAYIYTVICWRLTDLDTSHIY